MTKLTLTNKPTDYLCKNLLANFAEGKPLSPDLVNFLARHEKTLSNPKLDSALNYYLKHLHNKTAHEKLNHEDITKLKKRLQLLVKSKNAKVEFIMTPSQFSQFRFLNYRELILFHGNQFLTGAPFIPGGVPHLIYFQWGNLFGVAKYVVLPEEKSLKSNVLIYFEDRQEREFIECIYQYNHKNAAKIDQHPQLMPVPQPEPPLPVKSLFQIPTLSLTKKDPLKQT
jgi:hypothetical protein